MQEILKDFFITKDFTILIIFLLVFIVYWFKNKYLRKFMEWVIKRTPTTLDNDLFPLVDQLVTVALFGSGIITVMIKLGVNTQTIATIGGAGTVAFGLAIKDTLANILAGFIITIDKPFKLGDKIKLASGEKVQVLDIGLRRTQFLYKETPKVKSILIVNNLDLVKNKIYNYTLAKELKK